MSNGIEGYSIIQIRGEKFRKPLGFGNRYLPYWIEEHNYIWTKLSFQPNEEKNIYLYYDAEGEPKADVLGDDRCVAFYPFNRDVFDFYRNYNGEAYGNVTYPKGFISKACIDFGSTKQTNNYVKINNIPIFSKMTFTFWVYLHKNNDKSNTLLSLASPNNVNELIIEDNPTTSKIGLFIKTEDVSDAISWNKKLATQEWYFLAFVFDEDYITLYVNDNYMGTIQYRNPDVSIHHNNCLIIGQKQRTLGGNFDILKALLGKIDNFRLWNDALVYDDIVKIYKHESSCFNSINEVFILADRFNTPTPSSEVWEVIPDHYSVFNGYLDGYNNTQRSSFKSLPIQPPLETFTIRIKWQSLTSCSLWNCPGYDLYVRVKDATNATIGKNHELKYLQGSSFARYTRLFGTEGLSQLVVPVTVPHIIELRYDGTYVEFWYQSNVNDISTLTRRKMLKKTQRTMDKLILHPCRKTRYFYALLCKHTTNPPFMLSTELEEGTWRYGGFYYNNRYKITFKNPNNFTLNDFQVRIPHNLVNNDIRLILFE